MSLQIDAEEYSRVDVPLEVLGPLELGLAFRPVTFELSGRGDGNFDE